MRRNILGQRLDALRKEAGLSQQELGAVLGVKQQTLNQWIRGDRGIKTEYLIAFAKYFDVTTDYLLGLSDCRQPEDVSIQDEIGLTESSIQALKELHRDYRALYLISALINMIAKKKLLDEFKKCADLNKSVSLKVAGLRITKEEDKAEKEKTLQNEYYEYSYHLNRLQELLAAEIDNYYIDNGIEHSALFDFWGISLNSKTKDISANELLKELKEKKFRKLVLEVIESKKEVSDIGND